MRSHFIVKLKDGALSTVSFSKHRMTIGRSPRNDIFVNDPFASRVHAEVHRERDNIILVDLDSANGTYINAKKVTEPAILQPGDHIFIGKTEIEYVEEDQSTVEASRDFLTGPHSVDLPSGTIMSSDKGLSANELLSLIEVDSRGEEAALKSKPEKAPVAIGGAAVPEAVSQRDMLGIVSKVGIALLPHTSLEETLKMTIELIFDVIPAERGFLFLKSGENLECKIAIDSHRNAIDMARVRISRSITDAVLGKQASILTSDAMHDPRFQGHESIIISNLRSVLAVPLSSDKETFGMIYVDNPFDSRFHEEDLKVITTIASVASIKIEHQQLLEQLFEKNRIEEELKVASEIQMKLLPVSAPKLEGWDIAGISFPCREIGGDYYDFIQNKSINNLIVVLGDVSGKGIGAALLMSSLHAIVRAQSKAKVTIKETVGEINQYIYENTPTSKFITLFYSELNPESGVLMYSNAGHNPPMLIHRNGEMSRLKVGGIPVGAMPDMVYLEGIISFDPGDVLVIYTDGVTEAVNERGEEFGEALLVKVVQKNIEKTASALRDKIDEALSQFVGNAAPHDDITIVIVKRELKLKASARAFK